jgi:hypothetical protein
VGGQRGPGARLKVARPTSCAGNAAIIPDVFMNNFLFGSRQKEPSAYRHRLMLLQLALRQLCP